MADALPPSLATALRPVLPELADAIIAAIGREVPDYARPLEGPFGRVLRTGVERALERFVDQIERPEADNASTRETYVALGRGEMRGGRSLDALLAAYRLGARLAWERFLAAGEAAGHEPATLYRLASAIFSYIDAISAESVEGYAQERAAAEGERQRRRRALALLLARHDVSADEVLDVARTAGWSRPPRVAGLVARVENADRLASRLGGDTIAAMQDGVCIAFVPDPDAPGRRAQLEAALDGTPAGLGPTVPLARSAHRDAAGMARPSRPGAACGRRAARASPDRPLPNRPAARALRRAHRRRRRPLRAGAGSAGGDLTPGGPRGARAGAVALWRSVRRAATLRAPAVGG